MTKRHLENNEPIFSKVKKIKRVIVLSDDESDTEKQYEIERIKAIKFENQKYYFFIKWKGYPESENSWEPQENLNSSALAHVRNIPIHIKDNKDKEKNKDEEDDEEEDDEEEDDEENDEGRYFSKISIF